MKVLFFHLFYVFQRCSTHLTLSVLFLSSSFSCWRQTSSRFFPWIFRYTISNYAREYLLTSVSEMAENCWNSFAHLNCLPLASYLEFTKCCAVLVSGSFRVGKVSRIGETTIYHWHTKMQEKRKRVLFWGNYSGENVSISIEFPFSFLINFCSCWWMYEVNSFALSRHDDLGCRKRIPNIPHFLHAKLSMIYRFWIIKTFNFKNFLVRSCWWIECESETMFHSKPQTRARWRHNPNFSTRMQCNNIFNWHFWWATASLHYESIQLHNPIMSSNYSNQSIYELNNKKKLNPLDEVFFQLFKWPEQKCSQKKNQNHVLLRFPEQFQLQ